VSTRPPLPPEPGKPRPPLPPEPSGRPKPPKPSARPKPPKRKSSSSPQLPELKIDFAVFAGWPALVLAWWGSASRKKRIWTVVACGLLLLFLLKAAGCGGASSPDNVRRSGGDPDAAAALEKVDKALAGKNVIYAQAPDLSLEVWYIKDGSQLLVSGPQGDALIDSEGSRLVFEDKCWRRAGQAPAPRPSSAVLPIDESSAVFSAPDIVDGKTYLAFTAQRLGSWPAGSGSLQLGEGDLPSQFSYVRDGRSDELVFKISYPDQSPLKNPKRCG